MANNKWFIISIIIFVLLIIIDYYNYSSIIGTFYRIPKYLFMMVTIIIFIQSVCDGTETNNSFFKNMRKVKVKKQVDPIN